MQDFSIYILPAMGIMIASKIARAKSQLHQLIS